MNRFKHKLTLLMKSFIHRFTHVHMNGVSQVSIATCFVQFNKFEIYLTNFHLVSFFGKMAIHYDCKIYLEIASKVSIWSHKLLNFLDLGTVTK